MHPFSAQLTLSQVIFLQSLLPKNYSFQVSTLDTKRNRSAKKLDESFTADFTICEKKIAPKPQNQMSNSKPDVQNSQELTPRKSKTIPPKAEQSSPGIHALTKPNLKKKLLRFLQKLRECKYSQPFAFPVDPIAEGVPHYLQIVKVPMDLSTVEHKLKTGAYDKIQLFYADMTRIFSNSYEFNSKESKIYTTTKKFEDFYLKLRQEHFGIVSDPEKKSQFCVSTEKIQSTPKVCKNLNKTIHAEQPTKSQLTLIEQMSESERKDLFHDIYQLPQHDIVKLIKIIDDGNLPKDWREFEFDLRDIDDDKFKRILKLIKESGKRSS